MDFRPECEDGFSALDRELWDASREQLIRLPHSKFRISPATLEAYNRLIAERDANTNAEDWTYRVNAVRNGEKLEYWVNAQAYIAYRDDRLSRRDKLEMTHAESRMMARDIIARQSTQYNGETGRDDL